MDPSTSRSSRLNYKTPLVEGTRPPALGSTRAAIFTDARAADAASAALAAAHAVHAVNESSQHEALDKTILLPYAEDLSNIKNGEKLNISNVKNNT